MTKSIDFNPPDRALATSAPCPGAMRRAFPCRRGSLSVVQLLVVSFFAVVVVFLFHVIAVIQDKLETQQAADAAARTAAVWLSRGLNALCATNHLIGETTAMLAVHEAMAGPDPGGKRGETAAEDARLAAAAAALVALLVEYPEFAWAAPFAVDKLLQPVQAEAAILKGKRDLKLALAGIYLAKAQAIAAGDGGEVARQHAYEKEVLVEDGEVDKLLQRAIGLRPANRRLRQRTLPQLRQYADDLVLLAPEAARLAAEEIGRRNGAAVALLPAELRLPVYRNKAIATPGGRRLEAGDSDPLARSADLSPILPRWYGPDLPTATYPPPPGVPRTAVTRRQVVKITQLCRATFPWVNYHRQPVLAYLRTPERFKWSHLDVHYFDESAGQTIRVCDELQFQGYSLHVLDRYTGPDKGYERWTDDPRDADSLFSVIAVAGRPRPAPKGVGAGFASMMPQRGLATAQAMVYNANPQQRHALRIDLRTKRIVPWHQPKTGWDTLQWQERADWRPGKGRTEYDNGMPYELIGKGTLLGPDYPRIRLAWQAKLTPVSSGRIDQLARGQSDLHELLRLKESEYAALLTH